MNTIATLLHEIQAAAQSLLAASLSPQQRPFVRHILNTAGRLYTLVEAMPPGDQALRAVLPILGKDFSQPQSALFGYARMLMESPGSFEAAPDEQQQLLLSLIYDRAVEVARLTEFTRTTAAAERLEQRRLPAQAVDYVALIRQHLPVWHFWLKSDPVRLVDSLPKYLPSVKAQPYHLAGLVEHTVLTLAKELMEHGEIHLMAREGNIGSSVVEAGIACSGIQLPPDDMALLFEKHGRHIYHEQLLRQGGRLKVQRIPGKGAAIWLVLPSAL
jgi:hypothetical protein